MTALLAMAWMPTAHAAESQVLGTAYLDALRAEIRTNHPSVAAARARVLAAEAGVRAVRLWEVPSAGVGLMAAVREMRADAWVGVYDWEQLRPQTLEFDLEFGVRTEKAGSSDKLKDTIDYGAGVERVRLELKDKRFKLLEALAEDLATILLNEFGAPWVRISVAKLNHVRGVKKLGVVITRGDTSNA